MFCPNCGTNLPGDAKFCGSCGSTLAAQQRAPVATAAAAPQVLVAEPSALVAPNAVPSIDDVVARGVSLPIGDSLSEAWQTMKPDLGLFVGVSAVLFFASVAVANIIPFVGGLLVAPIVLGIDIMAHRKLLRQEISFANGFDGIKRIGPFLILSLIRGLGISLGLMLLVLPGIWFAVATMWAWHLCLDREMEPVDAIKASMKVVHSDFTAHLLFGFVMSLVGGAGALACWFGALATMPLSQVATAIAYKKNFGLSGGALRLK